MTSICGITNIDISHLLLIPQIRSLQYLTDSQQKCLVNLRITYNDYTPWNSYHEMLSNLQITFIVLCLPVLTWYILLYILHRKKNQNQGYDIVNGNKLFQVLIHTLQTTLNGTDITCLNELTSYIWIYSSIASLICLLSKHPILILKYLILYQNRALLLILLLQLTFLCLGLSIHYSQIHLVYHFKNYETTITTALEMVNLNKDLYTNSNISENVISASNTKNPFPNKKYQMSVYKDYLFFTWNIIVLIISNGLWLNLWEHSATNYFTNTISLCLLIFSLLISWFIVWYPFKIMYWYEHRTSNISYLFWFISLLFTATSLFYSDEISLTWLYTNDSYTNWISVISVFIWLQLLMIVKLLFLIIQNSYFRRQQHRTIQIKNKITTDPNNPNKQTKSLAIWFDDY